MFANNVTHASVLFHRKDESSMKRLLEVLRCNDWEHLDIGISFLQIPPAAPQCSFSRDCTLLFWLRGCRLVMEDASLT